MSGENALKDSGKQWDPGSSPRERGKHPDGPAFLKNNRLIPA
ncbi:hypothetical protein HMPREF1978_01881 [Actinomyces graevenitzii F0530]|uniref:Uncharacterized protein n=1 Tax=Actinomyces graevenitzii F0530 TaxID=1321817 RepID=U1R6S0_9ACTO|nr:hypothetical protein HMPREF1978_01881 [Actinomyces graevenitzii F0530]